MLIDRDMMRGRIKHAALFGVPPAVLIAIASFALLDPVMAVVSCLLAAAMAGVAVSDARRFIVPDILSLPAIPAGLLVSGLLLEHLAAALLGALALLALRQAYFALRGREGLGLGDVKLAAVAGAWTGLASLPSVMLIACMAAIGSVLVMKATARATVTAVTPVPFGTYLAPSIWLVWFARTAGIMDAAI